MTVDEQYDKLANSIQAVQMGMEITVVKLSDIESHLARLNSKVATHEGEINKLTLAKAYMDGSVGTIKLGMSIVWGVVLALLSGGIFYFIKAK